MEDYLALPREHTATFKTYLSTKSDYIAVLTLLAIVLHLWKAWPRRASVPILSYHKGWTAPWKDAVRYLHNSPGVLKDGYQKVSQNLCLTGESVAEVFHEHSIRNRMSFFNCPHRPAGTLSFRLSSSMRLGRHQQKA